MSYGIQVDKHYFAKNDCLESNDDLIMLFDAQSRYIDKNGKFPVITANTVVANPDFRRIAESELQIFDYELITTTYKKCPNHEIVMELWRKQ